MLEAGNDKPSKLKRLPGFEDRVAFTSSRPRFSGRQSMRDRLQPLANLNTQSLQKRGYAGLRGYSAVVPEELPPAREVTSELQRVTRQVGM